MANMCKKYDIEGKEAGSLEIPLLNEEKKAHYQSIKDYIVALRKNARQWSANTKDRSQSHHSGAKPHAQKGTGKARQGFLGAPQYKGGVRVHTPKPKFNQHVRINRKERQAAIATILNSRIEENSVRFLEDNFQDKLVGPKTAVLSNFLSKLDISGKSCLFLAPRKEDGQYVNLQKSLKNLPKVSFQYIENLNGYNIMAHQNIIVLESAYENIKEIVSV